MDVLVTHSNPHSIEDRIKEAQFVADIARGRDLSYPPPIYLYYLSYYSIIITFSYSRFLFLILFPFSLPLANDTLPLLVVGDLNQPSRYELPFYLSTNLADKLVTDQKLRVKYLDKEGKQLDFRPMDALVPPLPPNNNNNSSNNNNNDNNDKNDNNDSKDSNTNKSGPLIDLLWHTKKDSSCIYLRCYLYVVVVVVSVTYSFPSIFYFGRI